MTNSRDLFDAAKRVRVHAHAPYSKFKVGAALIDTEGRVHVGCNVENVAYPEGTCAEAGAIAAMCAAGGERSIAQIVVIADSDPPVTPCGGCRQKLAEFSNADMAVHLADLTGIRSTTLMSELLPGAFSNDHLGTEKGS